jgi:predicted metal-dependent phosphoesterase TrpH
MIVDFHLHTTVSDGDLDPLALLSEAARWGITHLSITDHDALGAYSWESGRVFQEARRLGLELTVGIEMDAELYGDEVHLLGFDFRRDDATLLAHLRLVALARIERARREIGLVNALLGDGTIAESEIFVQGRATVMKPHFIHPLLEKGHFSSYEEANAWFRRNVKAGIKVPKPLLPEAIELIHGAGGWASLAHPGYYEKIGIVERLPALRAMGLDAIELDYPYHACSPHLFSAAAETAFIEAVRAAGKPLGFRFTRGSDSHTASDFERVSADLARG